MIRVLVMANDTLLADAIASLLAEQVGVDSIRLTHHRLESDDLHSLVMVVEEGKPADGSIFYSFSSLCKTQEREKRDAADFVWAYCRI
jgi:ApbE superfamily uncharacterized protein (UPF0280 family)